MNKKREPIELTLQVLTETEKAYLVTEGLLDDKEKKITHWLPKSQCTLHPDFLDGPDDNGTLILEVPEWLAREKGLI